MPQPVIAPMLHGGLSGSRVINNTVHNVSAPLNHGGHYMTGYNPGFGMGRVGNFSHGYMPGRHGLGGSFMPGMGYSRFGHHNGLIAGPGVTHPVPYPTEGTTEDTGEVA